MLIWALGLKKILNMEYRKPPSLGGWVRAPVEFWVRSSGLYAVSPSPPCLLRASARVQTNTFEFLDTGGFVQGPNRKTRNKHKSGGILDCDFHVWEHGLCACHVMIIHGLSCNCIMSNSSDPYTTHFLVRRFLEAAQGCLPCKVM